MPRIVRNSRYDCRRSRRSSHLRCCKDCAGWNEDVKPYPQDLEKAKELLAEAGYENGLDLKMYVSGEVRSRAAQVVQAQLAQVGINVDINVYEWGDITCIEQADEDRLWLGTNDHGILLWNRSTGKAEPFWRDAEGQLPNPVVSMLKSKDGKLWVGTFNGACIV